MATTEPMATTAPRRFPWGPVLLVAALSALLTAQIFDPSLQLFDRDTGRSEYAYKQFIAARLRAWQLPLWFPWTASGMSLLAEMTPALFHPFTLLYLALPFELAFKLNHVLPVPVAAAGAYLLSRKLGASAWAAAVAGVVYGGSGYLASMCASNVHFAAGAAALPLAIHGLLHCLERPGPLRLLWAGFALTLPLLGGEPQSALFAGYGGVLAAVLLHGLRGLRTAALWGAVALLLGAPALFPGLQQLRRSSRRGGVSAYEHTFFAARPARLLGLALPWAFDDAPERTVPGGALPAFTEYFAGPTGSAFVTSIALSIPALLLAAFARGRKAAMIVALAAIFALGSLGGAFEAPLRYLLPGHSLFRFPEKDLGPLTLLLALLSALGAGAALRTPRAAGRLALASWGCAALLFSLRAVLQSQGEALLPALRLHGQTHDLGPAQDFAAALSASLLTQGLLATGLGLLALARWWKPVGAAPALAAAVCATGAVLASRELFFVAPVELLHGPFALAHHLEAQAGTSPGRWRIDSDPSGSSTVSGFDLRTSHALWTSQALAPLFNTLAGVESVALYASLTDADYLDAWHAAPRAMTQLFGVRFQVRTPQALTEDEARANGFARTELGLWVHELPFQPRAFLVGCSRDAPRAETLRLLASARFDPHQEAIGPALSSCAPGTAGTVELQRPAPERLSARTQARREALLVFAEHYDPGWSATIDGQPAELKPADLTAMGVRVPAGEHRVELRFWPRGLTAGLCCSLLTALALALRARLGSPNVQA
jgi:hypothetical protein